MKELPLVCKFTYSYTYRKRMREKPLYALLLEYNHIQKAYYANLIESNGTLHGRHYDKWLKWDEQTIDKTMVSIEDLPSAVLKTVKEQVSISEEVNRRSSKSS